MQKSGASPSFVGSRLVRAVLRACRRRCAVAVAAAAPARWGADAFAAPLRPCEARSAEACAWKVCTGVILWDSGCAGKDARKGADESSDEDDESIPKVAGA